MAVIGLSSPSEPREVNPSSVVFLTLGESDQGLKLKVGQIERTINSRRVGHERCKEIRQETR